MSPAKKKTKVPAVRTGQVREDPTAVIASRREILVGEERPARGGTPMFVVYRRDTAGLWHKVKVYGAKRIATTYSVVTRRGVKP